MVRRPRLRVLRSRQGSLAVPGAASASQLGPRPGRIVGPRRSTAAQALLGRQQQPSRGRRGSVLVAGRTFKSALAVWAHNVCTSDRPVSASLAPSNLQAGVDVLALGLYVIRGDNM
jgi:hypothetical protein